MRFEQLQARAKKAWQEVVSPQIPLIRMGMATCGRAAGGQELLQAFQEELAKNKIQAQFSEVGCLGLCYAEPMAEIILPGRPGVLFAKLTPAKMKKIGEDYLVHGKIVGDSALAVMGPARNGTPAFTDLPMVKGQQRTALRNCGIIDPTNLDHYLAHDGYVGLKRALSLSPDEVIAEVKTSGLRGRGGAGFPTGQKWEFCRKATGTPKYLICNADEGDPGAFMDRSVLESDPHSVLEGMALAAYAIGAEHGYIYCRAEYPLALERLDLAIRQATEHNLLGDNILGSGFNLHLKIKMGAGAFVCGEETALMASIEGRRGMPRTRPPFPANQGLFGKPTTINNVETLANLPPILAKGGAWYAGFGTEKSKGTKTFALAGKVDRTGLIEVPMGITLKEIVFDIGGGSPIGKKIKAVQTGGPSGGCIPAELFDLPVDYERLAAVGSIMGSGGMVVLDENTCMVDVARYFLEFTKNESCGKCAPCRLGTRQMHEILTDICAGRGRPGDIELLEEIGAAVRKGSLCALGGTAPNPVLTTIQHYRHEYEQHIQDQRCFAGVCKALITYSINAETCNGCRVCATNCPQQAISGEKKKPHVIDTALCIKCGICYEMCKFDAVVRQ
ncbi:MAG: NADH dehydrogenase [Deltaproteobacteria bacterium RBG_13_61_14]|nr:MAG: NADH dehydrogenase [Deltaproteobacteria bacterium RBG_13_61_14]